MVAVLVAMVPLFAATVAVLVVVVLVMLVLLGSVVLLVDVVLVGVVRSPLGRLPGCCRRCLRC